MSEHNQKNAIIWFAAVGIVLAGIFVWRTFFVLPPNKAIDPLENIVKQAQTWGPAYKEWTGKPSPNFELVDIKGNKYKLSDHRGKTVMVVFWATWCPPCREEIPGLIELRKNTGEEKLGIVAISFEDAAVVKDFVEKTGINYTIAVTTMGSLPSPFNNINAFPTTFYVDKNGVIRLVSEGLVEAKETALILDVIAD